MKRARCRSRAATSCAAKPFSTRSAQDALRYFLLREIVFGQDGSFSFDALVQRFNADLANGLGNLSSRTLSMIMRYFDGEVPYPRKAASLNPDFVDEGSAVKQQAEATIQQFNAQFDQFDFSGALKDLWAFIGAVNRYIAETHPWSLAEEKDHGLARAAGNDSVHRRGGLRIVTALAHPIIPEATERIWRQLGLGDISKLRTCAELTWGQLQLGTKLGKVEPVFPRADKSMIERMQTDGTAALHRERDEDNRNERQTKLRSRRYAAQLTRLRPDCKRPRVERSATGLAQRVRRRCGRQVRHRSALCGIGDEQDHHRRLS